MTRLTKAQETRLSGLFGALIDAIELPVPSIGELEPGYTGRVIAPRVAEWLETVGRKELFLRADGPYPPPLPLSTGGLSFLPDLEISAYGKRYVALEVKFVRAAGATGAVTKALGQGLLYRTCGVPAAHVLLVDLRGKTASLVGDDVAAFAELRGSGIWLHARRATAAG